MVNEYPMLWKSSADLEGNSFKERKKNSISVIDTTSVSVMGWKQSHHYYHQNSAMVMLKFSSFA